jgi:hypothetical protein
MTSLLAYNNSSSYDNNSNVYSTSCLHFSHSFLQSFSQAKVVSKNGKKIVEEIAKDLHSLLHLRIEAVKVSHRLCQQIVSFPSGFFISTFIIILLFAENSNRDTEDAKSPRQCDNVRQLHIP